jgi:hypothetical protein
LQWENGLASHIFCNYNKGMEKRMGRPPLEPGEVKDQVYQLRMTADERAAYEAAAKRAGKPLSKWIREKLNRAAKR